ncbi:hypothetical protein PV328_004085 [Microctonus aethiopoides]|uniref:Uncharacterized protein n=1 Tax=Microctonus aethiopoides TaxID=144406 RepID=A0AA39KLC3_9HYME|nr:hypothetical protein PV328_004085 [Microctonus aethiopoides]
MANVGNFHQIANNLLEIIGDECEDSDEFDMIEDSDDDLEWEYCSAHLNLSFRKRHPLRLQNFFEEVIPSSTDKEFKSHFRKIPGCKMIPPDKQLFIAIWKMATPDSYRYNNKILVKFRITFFIIS